MSPSQSLQPQSNVGYLTDMNFVLHMQLHTSELNDGYDWGRLNLQSVTEQSSMDDFLATAELAGTEFVAGKSYLTQLMHGT